MNRNARFAGLFRVLSLVLLLSVLGGRAFGQVFNVYEGYGRLENGWTESGTAGSLLTSATEVIENSYGWRLTFGANQNMQLNFGGFNSKYIGALEFYVYVGPAAFTHNINISLVTSAGTTAALSMNTYAVGGTPKTATWTPVIIPLSAWGILATNPVTVTNVIFQQSNNTAEPAFWIGFMGWPAFIAPATVTIGVNPSSQLTVATGPRTVDQKMFGVNADVWDNNFASTTCQDLIGRANFRGFRFPGGSLSDTYHWATNKTEDGTSWPTSFDTFASSALARNARGQDFITVNYGSGTAAEAAGWVTYSNITKHYGIKYWELGNEVYGTWEHDEHAQPNDPVTYANQFAAYATAMKAADPTIKVGVVATPGEDSFVNYPGEVVQNPVTHANHSGWTSVMLSTLAGLGVTPDFIVYHRYPEYEVDCDYTLLTGNGGWAADMSNMRTMLNDYLGSSPAANVQIMCTENNADAGTAGKQMTSLTNAVYLADSFGQLLQTEANSYVWWDLVNGQSTNPNDGPWLYGWRPYGDEGMFSTDFTQIYPMFFSEQLVNLFAGPGDQVVSCTSSFGLLTAYATKRADGTVRVMVINLTPNQSINGRLQFSGGFLPQSTAIEYQYGIAQDNLQQQGWWPTIKAVDIKGTGLSNNYTFPPYSMTVLLYTPGGQVIKAPPLFVMPPLPKNP